MTLRRPERHILYGLEADMTQETYRQLFSEIHGHRQSYYGRWIHDVPLVITPARAAEMERLSRILYTCACRYVESYRDWLDMLPYDELVLETLEYCERYPFRAGTYRPDIIFCDDGAIRICEITSRFFGNGYFLMYFYDEAARRMCEVEGVDDFSSSMEEMLAYFAAMADGYKRLVLLKSADRSDSIRLYVPFYEALGLDVTILESDQVEANAALIEDAFVVSALNQVDLAALSADTRHLMADVGCRNDFRSIYLLHDKRFFRLFAEDSFTRPILTEEETAFLRAHVIPTFLPQTDPDEFERARRDKDAYIVKHRCLGKSEKVNAGFMCTQEEWESLLDTSTVGDMILQPFQSQRSFPVVWEGQEFDDYACGSLLTVDDRYFGPGIVRTSSCPVINKTDDRKMAFVITEQADRFKAYHEL